MSTTHRSLFTGAARATIGLALLLPFATRAQAQRDDEYRSRLDTTVAFDKGGTVSITNRSGEIIVTGWARNEVRVHATSESDNIRFDATRTRASVEVGGFGRSGDTRFEVSVPYGARVIARAQGGDVSVRGTKGEVDATSQSGDMTIEDVQTHLEVNSLSGDLRVRGVQGDVAVNLISGDLTLEDANGNLDVASVSGDIALRGIVSKSVRARTTSGDVSYDGTIDRAGRYEFAAHSGDVGLTIPRDASAQLTVSTWNGDIESEFPITLAPGEHGIGSGVAKRFTFDIGGGGGARVTAESFSGDITIRRR